MRNSIVKLTILLAFLLPKVLFGGVEFISEQEFRQLAAETAAKVNLFREVWRIDPNAEFYGGTSRDFLYWLKGQFSSAHTPAEARAVVDKLHKLQTIDVQSFIIGDSDIDLISKDPIEINAKDWGVRKIDSQPNSIFDPNTDEGFNEFHQGHAPAEKIRLSKSGIVDFPKLGDGAHEVYIGKISVQFASAKDFAKTKFAQEGLNHEVLLALRYMRLLAINYFRTYGKDFPDPQKLASTIDPKSAARAKEIILRAAQSGELAEHRKNEGPVLKSSIVNSSLF